MRRVAAAVLLAASLWIPTAVSPAVVQAATCTGWSSTTTPPPTVRVLRTGTGVVETVDFQTYVNVVMATEWPSNWPIEALRAGAVTVKQYAWYYTMHYRGGTGTGGCYDVKDNTIDQVYLPETRTPVASHLYAVGSTWTESLLKDGAFILTGYRSGSDVACGADADGYHLWQYSAHYCAYDGKTGEDILHVYFDPGATLQGVIGPPPADASTFHPVTPARILNTIDGTGGLTGKFVSHVARTFQVTGNGGVPAGASAVTGNLTVTQQNSLGYAFIGPVAMNWPASSTINFPAMDERANAVTVALGARGTLGITYAATDLTATAHIIFDVTGYYTPDLNGATYYPLNPARILDTRPTVPSGNPTNIGLVGPIGTGVAQTFQVTGMGGVPAGAIAVTGNLTVTEQSSGGAFYLGPVASSSPTIFTLDFPKGDNRANAVTMILGAGGKLGLTFVAPSAGQTAHAVFDVTGYFMPGTGGGAFHALTPARILDSRPTVPSGNPTNVGLSGPFRSHVARTFQVTGMGGVPAGATAVTGNLTVTQQSSLGYLEIGPIAMNWPSSSTLNFPVGDNRANAVTVTLGSGGTLATTYAASDLSTTSHVIFDVAGYFTPATSQ
jgi:hypothetical protein